jgi:hypothetical protein
MGSETNHGKQRQKDLLIAQTFHGTLVVVSYMSRKSDGNLICRNSSGQRELPVFK